MVHNWLKQVGTCYLVLLTLIRDGESTVRRRRSCDVFLQRESAVFVRDVRYAVDAEAEIECGITLEVSNSIKAFGNFIDDLLDRRQSYNCVHLNALAYKLRKRPIKGVHVLSFSASERDSFFINLALDLLPILPAANLMEFPGIIAETNRVELVQLLRIAQKVGIDTSVLQRLLSLSPHGEGADEYLSSLIRLLKFYLYENVNIAEFRVKSRLDAVCFSNRPALARLDKASKMFNQLVGGTELGNILVQNFAYFIEKSHGMLQSELQSSGITAVSEAIELLPFMYVGSDEEARELCEEVVKTAAMELTASLWQIDAGQAEIRESISSTIEKVANILPQLKEAESSADLLQLGGLMKRLRETVNSVSSVYAEISIIPKLLDSIKIASFHIIQNKKQNTYSGDVENQQLAFLEAVVRASVQVARMGVNGRPYSLVALSDYLASVYHVPNEPLEMGTLVLKTAFTFQARFGIDILASSPNLLSGFSSKQIEFTRQIVDVFTRFSENEWDNLFADPSFYRRVGSASERALEEAAGFLDKFSINEQLRRTKGSFDDFPLVSPSRFLLEFIGYGEPDFTSESSSPYSLSVLKVYPLLFDAAILRSSVNQVSLHLEKAIPHFAISPFLGRYLDYVDLAFDLSKLYNVHGAFLQHHFSSFSFLAHTLPEELLHADLRSGETLTTHELLVSAGRSVLELLTALTELSQKGHVKSLGLEENEIRDCTDQLSSAVKNLIADRGETAVIRERLSRSTEALREFGKAIEEKRAFDASERCS